MKISGRSGLLWEMSRAEWLLREQSSVTGFLWTLLHPLLLFGVLYAVFTRWAEGRSADYAAFLIVGVVQYGFFSGATQFALSSLVRRRGLVMNFVIPRDTVVLSAVASSAFSHLIETAVMIAFLALLGVRPAWSWLALPAILLVEQLWALACALALAPSAARYRDLERVWSLIVNAGFFLTPIFYTLEGVGPERRALLLLNPMTHVIEMSRACLLKGETPSPGRLASWLALSAAAAAAAHFRFRSRQGRLSDYLDR